MAMAAAFRLLRRNTFRKMHPTISQFNKTSLSPSLPAPPSFLCSFPLVPSLWCSPPLRLEYRSTTILKCEPFAKYGVSANRAKKHGRDQEESDPNERDKKRQRGPEGGETEESGDDSAVNVGLYLEITGDGEYVLKMKRTITQGSEGTTTTELEREKQMAQNVAMIRELLQDMEGKLLAQSRASLIRSITVHKSD